MAIVGLLLAIGGVATYFNFRNLARKQAREEAENIASQVAEKAAISRIEQLLPQLVEEYGELARSSVTDQIVEQLARSQDDKGS
jgi:predicted negative regulator of RcsB-dependent stress response